MSDLITTAFVSQFKDNVMMLSQQKGSKLRGLVRSEDLQGAVHYFERLGPSIAARKVNRHAPTPLTVSQHTRRRVSSQTWQIADLVELHDKLRMLIDPTSDYVRSFGMALGRALDQAIITAFGAAVETGQDGSGSASFDSGMAIANGGTGLTIDKLRNAMYLLDANDVVEEGRVFVGSAKAKQQLLETTEVTSSDYNTVRALVNGSINEFLGFKFVWIGGSTVDLGLPLSGNIRTCYFFQRDAMALAVAQDLSTFIDRRPDMQQATQVYASMDFGAVRLEEEAVGSVDIDESV